MTIPSEQVHDTFRRRSYGKIDAPTNSKPMDDSFHVDRSRLGVHSEWDETAPNEWGGKGKVVEVSNDTSTIQRARPGPGRAACRLHARRIR
jgi:hypothetical protein